MTLDRPGNRTAERGANPRSAVLALCAASTLSPRVDPSTLPSAMCHTTIGFGDVSHDDWYGATDWALRPVVPASAFRNDCLLTEALDIHFCRSESKAWS